MVFEKEIGGKKLGVEIGRFAEQAGGAVTVTLGETVVLVTATRSVRPKEGIDFFPLSVDYDEKLYAAGRIKGSKWVKREGRPTDEAVLSARFIDRAIRPLFPEWLKNEVQVIATVLSFDGENDPDIMSLLGASLALSISDIPFNGPIAGIRLGLKDGQFIVNPTYQERENSQFDLVFSGLNETVNMIEAVFDETSEEKIIEAVEFGIPVLKELVTFQKEIISKLAKEKLVNTEEAIDQDFLSDIKSFLGASLVEALFERKKPARNSKLDKLKDDLFSYLKQKYDSPALNKVGKIFDEAIYNAMRDNILNNERRPDGRALDELREISCGVGVLPRTHGSGLFNRGNTQVLSVLTLAAPGFEQYLDTIENAEGRKRFMHHYNFPKFSVGEVGRLGAPGRREIGHGALAEKALQILLPKKKDFPYTIRIVSEVLSSNGSSSMASICGSVLALYDGGIKIKAPAAGIAMGVIIDDNGRYKILTDIQGPEDLYGDMDFKVAGTTKGLLALQLDVKVTGVTVKILKEGLDQARKARLEILEKMLAVIAQPRETISSYAPRIYTLEINSAKIGLVIGPKGKTINEIIMETGATIDIEDSGLVFITATSEESAQKAIKRVQDLTHEIKIGEIVDGKVKKIMEFGAFVEVMPGVDGLIHVSEFAKDRVNIDDILAIGDIITVRIKNIDNTGRISLTKNVK
ncbi:polyribonucleotide nucleotidyltransferase [Candidatus Azambacteria bacterium]|nr:polyribonucleotide nucleotidyltransferase [Candidatus Azambacteria bacterium]